MIEWGFLKKLFTISCVGATTFTAGVFGSGSRALKPAVDKILEKAHNSCRTSISIEDCTGQKVVFEGDDLAFTKERKDSEKIISICVSRNDEGLVEICLPGGMGEFFRICGRDIKIYVSFSKSFREFCTANSREKALPWETIQSGTCTTSSEHGNYTQHQFVKILGYAAPTWAKTIKAHPDIEVKGTCVTCDRSMPGRFFSGNANAKINQRNRLQVETFLNENDEKPALVIVDSVSKFNKTSDNSPIDDAMPR